MIYRICRVLVMSFFKLFYPTKYYGWKNIEHKNKQYIVVCNHLAKIDIIILVYVFKYKIYFLSKKEYYQNKLRSSVFRYFGGIPIDRDHADLDAMKKTFKHLKDGHTIVIFPEGTRNKTTQPLLPVKDGAAMFAFKNKIDVVPMYIHHKGQVFKKNYVQIGKPYNYEEFYGQKYSQELGEKMSKIMVEKILECRSNLLNNMPKKAVKANENRNS